MRIFYFMVVSIGAILLGLSSCKGRTQNQNSSPQIVEIAELSDKGRTTITYELNSSTYRLERKSNGIKNGDVDFYKFLDAVNAPMPFKAGKHLSFNGNDRQMLQQELSMRKQKGGDTRAAERLLEDFDAAVDWYHKLTNPKRITCFIDNGRFSGDDLEIIHCRKTYQGYTAAQQPYIGKLIFRKTREELYSSITKSGVKPRIQLTRGDDVWIIYVDADDLVSVIRNKGAEFLIRNSFVMGPSYAEGSQDMSTELHDPKGKKAIEGSFRLHCSNRNNIHIAHTCSKTALIEGLKSINSAMGTFVGDPD